MLLEPIMKLEISTPDSYVGDIVSNLQQRRGLVTNTAVHEHLTIIEAEAPLAALFGHGISATFRASSGTKHYRQKVR